MLSKYYVLQNSLSVGPDPSEWKSTSISTFWAKNDTSFAETTQNQRFVPKMNNITDNIEVLIIKITKVVNEDLHIAK